MVITTGITSVLIDPSFGNLSFAIQTAITRFKSTVWWRLQSYLCLTRTFFYILSDQFHQTVPNWIWRIFLIFSWKKLCVCIFKIDMNERWIIFNSKLHNPTFHNCDEVSQPKNLNKGEKEHWKKNSSTISQLIPNKYLHLYKNNVFRKLFVISMYNVQWYNVQCTMVDQTILFVLHLHLHTVTQGIQSIDLWNWWY